LEAALIHKHRARVSPRVILALAVCLQCLALATFAAATFPQSRARVTQHTGLGAVGYDGVNDRKRRTAHCLIAVILRSVGSERRCSKWDAVANGGNGARRVARSRVRAHALSLLRKSAVGGESRNGFNGILCSESYPDLLPTSVRARRAGVLRIKGAQCRSHAVTEASDAFFNARTE
jgi:hypothetical protein